MFSCGAEGHCLTSLYQEFINFYSFALPLDAGDHPSQAIMPAHILHNSAKSQGNHKKAPGNLTNFQF